MTITDPAIIEQTQSLVKSTLAEKFPNAIDFGDGTYAVPQGSSSVAITVRPYLEHDCMVEIVAQVVTGGKVVPETMKWLLRKNVELHFGAFGLLFDDTIVFSYSLPGKNLNSSELEAAITSVGIVADHYDDDLVAKIGGKRVSDVELM